VLRFAEPHPVVPLTAINALWLRRHSAGRGAVIGAVAVGTASFALAALVCVALGEGDGCHEWGYVVGFSLAGGRCWRADWRRRRRSVPPMAAGRAAAGRNLIRDWESGPAGRSADTLLAEAESCD
jgi:hypothetical protein